MESLFWVPPDDEFSSWESFADWEAWFKEFHDCDDGGEDEEW